MSDLHQIRIVLEGIAHILADNRLKVPAFQRSFAWEVTHVNDLLQDVSSAQRSDAIEYFLGSIVVSTEHAGVLEVIDGQQRLATTTIILAQIRNYLLDNEEPDRAATLENEFLLKRDLRTQEAVPRLTLNEVDNDFFQQKVVVRPAQRWAALTPTRKSHALICDAIIAARKHIDAVAATSRNPVDALLDYVEFLGRNAKAILVRVPDHANAFTIFETLNDRGITLAISDLLKNHLFFRAGNRISEVQLAWAAMSGALTAIDTDASPVDYIRHYWSSKNGATRERDLYAAIRKRASSKQAAVDLAHGLESGARYYAAIVSASHELWNDYGPTARQCIEAINLLRMVQVRPLLIAILQNFSVAEVRKALRLIVAWGVRFLVHGGLGGGVLEDNYCERARAINTGSIKGAKQLAQAMLEVVPSDKSFELAFAAASVNQTYLARYYLRVLERQARGEAQPELVPNASEDEVTLEHILPLNPEQNWPDFDDDAVRSMRRRLGNLVLLRQKLNSTLRNASFAKKRGTLASSQFSLTKEVSKAVTWNAKAIVTRQERLAKLAVSAWPIR